jgi:methylisocitrate lyase
MRTTRQKRADFRKLHENGCFVLPNPWDVGTARIFQMNFTAWAAPSSASAPHAAPSIGLERT